MHTKAKIQHRTPAYLFGATSALLTAGCASIFNGGAEVIRIATDPPGANFDIKRAGSTIASATGTTPSEAALVKKRGYFSGQSYVLTVSKEGYENEEVDIKAGVSGWYFGNLIFGGLIGLLAVDPATGGMWSLSPDDITLTLKPLTGDPGPAPVTAPPADETPVMAPVVAAPVPAPSPPLATAATLGAGQTAWVLQAVSLRTRPASDGSPSLGLAAGSQVKLLGEARNTEGTWWYVEAGSAKGWLAEASIRAQP